MDETMRQQFGYEVPRYYCAVQCGKQSYHVFTSERTSQRGLWVAIAKQVPDESLPGYHPLPLDTYKKSWFLSGQTRLGAVKVILEKFHILRGNEPILNVRFPDGSTENITLPWLEKWGGTEL